MRLSYNLPSLNIFKEQQKVLKNQSSSLERISSGNKINSAKDNPNAIAQSERMRMQIRGIQMASKNVQDGVSMLQTAEGGLEGITNMLQRVRELTVQAGSGANTDEDKKVIQMEINQMLEGIDQTAKNTEFNGVHLLCDDGAAQKPLNMVTGANSDEKIEIPVFNIIKDSLKDSDGNKLGDIDVAAQGGTDKALKVIDASLDTVLSARSQFGALENRFESSFNSLGEIGDKIQGAESSVRDVDIAEEMVEFSKSNILLEAGNAMMVQSNKLPQDVLRILENIRK